MDAPQDSTLRPDPYTPLACSSGIAPLQPGQKGLRSRSPSPRPPRNRPDPNLSHDSRPVPTESVVTPTATFVYPAVNCVSPHPETVEPLGYRDVQQSDPEEPVEETDLEIYPCTPIHIQDWTYELRRVVPKPTSSEKEIMNLVPMKLTFRPKNVAEGWTNCSHPEGRHYFRRRSKTRAFTNSIIYEDDSLAQVERAIKQVRGMLREFPNTPKDAEIVLEVHLGCVYYYCASWERRLVFWPQELPIGFITSGWRPVFDDPHLTFIGDALLFRISYPSIYGGFRIHAELFPKSNKSLVKSLTHELQDTLNFALSDVLTSDTTTVPFEVQDLMRMLTTANNLRDGRGSGHQVWVIARIMGILCKERFMNFHGQIGARLNATDSLHSPTNVHPRSTLFWLTSPWLFWWPSVYLRELEDIWVDATIRRVHWSKFISELREDWERSTTPSTVLLSANVGFLAIQSIDSDHGFNARSVAQISSYASTLLSLANYVTCQILLRQHRRVTINDTSHAADFLRKQEKEKFGLEVTAIAFSLPHGFFSWSMLSFLFSICWVFFWETNLSTRVVLGTLLIILIILVSLVAFLGWRDTIDEVDLSWYQRFVKPLVSRLKRLRLSPRRRLKADGLPLGDLGSKRQPGRADTI